MKSLVNAISTLDVNGEADLLYLSVNTNQSQAWFIVLLGLGLDCYELSELYGFGGRVSIMKTKEGFMLKLHAKNDWSECVCRDMVTKLLQAGLPRAKTPDTVYAFTLPNKVLSIRNIEYYLKRYCRAMECANINGFFTKGFHSVSTVVGDFMKMREGIKNVKLRDLRPGKARYTHGLDQKGRYIIKPVKGIKPPAGEPLRQPYFQSKEEKYKYTKTQSVGLFKPDAPFSWYGFPDNSCGFYAYDRKDVLLRRLFDHNFLDRDMTTYGTYSKGYLIKKKSLSEADELLKRFIGLSVFESVDHLESLYPQGKLEKGSVRLEVMAHIKLDSCPCVLSESIDTDTGSVIMEEIEAYTQRTTYHTNRAPYIYRIDYSSKPFTQAKSVRVAGLDMVSRASQEFSWNTFSQPPLIHFKMFLRKHFGMKCKNMDLYSPILTGQLTWEKIKEMRLDHVLEKIISNGFYSIFFKLRNMTDCFGGHAFNNECLVNDNALYLALSDVDIDSVSRKALCGRLKIAASLLGMKLCASKTSHHLRDNIKQDLGRFSRLYGSYRRKFSSPPTLVCITLDDLIKPALESEIDGISEVILSLCPNELSEEVEWSFRRKFLTQSVVETSRYLSRFIRLFFSGPSTQLGSDVGFPELFTGLDDSGSNIFHLLASDSNYSGSFLYICNEYFSDEETSELLSRHNPSNLSLLNTLLAKKNMFGHTPLAILFQRAAKKLPEPIDVRLVMTLMIKKLDFIGANHQDCVSLIEDIKFYARNGYFSADIPETTRFIQEILHQKLAALLYYFVVYWLPIDQAKNLGFACYEYKQHALHPKESEFNEHIKPILVEYVKREGAKEPHTLLLRERVMLAAVCDLLAPTTKRYNRELDITMYLIQMQDQHAALPSPARVQMVLRKLKPRKGKEQTVMSSAISNIIRELNTALHPGMLKIEEFLNLYSILRAALQTSPSIDEEQYQTCMNLVNLLPHLAHLDRVGRCHLLTLYTEQGFDICMSSMKQISAYTACQRSVYFLVEAFKEYPNLLYQLSVVFPSWGKAGRYVRSWEDGSVYRQVHRPLDANDVAQFRKICDTVKGVRESRILQALGQKIKSERSNEARHSTL